MLDGVPRVGISRSDMWKIGFPENPIDADKIAHLDAHGLEPEIDIDLSPEQFARPCFDAFSPQTIFLPLVFASFEHRTHPAQTGFGENPIELGKLFEHARKNQIRN